MDQNEVELQRLNAGLPGQKNGRQLQRLNTETADPRHWQQVFNKYDTNGDGVLNLAEMKRMLQAANYAHDLPDEAFRKIIDMADHNNDGHLHFAEFLHLVHSDVLPRGVFSKLLTGYVHNLVAPRGGKVWHDVPDGQYEEEYSCYPLPIAMLIVALIEMILFLVDVISTGDSYSVNGPIATVLIYNPHKRHEAWRFLTYMFVHVGEMHLIVNMLVLLMLGIPLEMVHHWWRVLIVYLAGVVAGSLGTSVSDPYVYLAGASGGVYAIITAHLATIIMNWSEMSFAIYQLVIFTLLIGFDVGTAIYQRYVAKMETHIGYMAHFGGALAGLLVGIYVLRNLNKKPWEKKIWWASLAIFVVLIGITIVWNIAFPEYFPPLMYNTYEPLP
ncbi:rhomboid-related protein 2 [Neocloeon triangulifer]|uniref:rhomboid-related protein 2 n=1 Tax=Neocloeon triangulifer TaxID=2078957 RepID=UPI00286F9719|nr:rhomboid-related protein 2 [Neocloeon triangulifer]XP_059470078.1 rhomboid-related protein 2 [Neocloeon triangulifer]